MPDELIKVGWQWLARLRDARFWISEYFSLASQTWCIPIWSDAMKYCYLWKLNFEPLWCNIIGGGEPSTRNKILKAKTNLYSSPVSGVVALGWYAGHYWEIGRQLHSCVQRDISDCCANPIISTSEGNYVSTLRVQCWRKIKTNRNISEWQ